MDEPQSRLALAMVDDRNLTTHTYNEGLASRVYEALGAYSKLDTPHYTFATRSDLLRTLNPNRWGLIEALTGSGPLGVRELARRVERDVKGVHTDAQALVACGLIDKLPDGKLSFPYAAVQVHFRLRAA